MNIEEERKAFVDFQVKVIFDKWSETIHAEQMANDVRAYLESYNWPEYYKQRFEVWLAAKAHAEEMLKRPCVIEPWPKFGTWSVKKPKGQAFRNIRLEFATAEDAKAWAKENGYRVIE